jgi:hypothetical protein
VIRREAKIHVFGDQNGGQVDFMHECMYLVKAEVLWVSRTEHLKYGQKMTPTLPVRIRIPSNGI